MIYDNGSWLLVGFPIYLIALQLVVVDVVLFDVCVRSSDTLCGKTENVKKTQKAPKNVKMNVLEKSRSKILWKSWICRTSRKF